MNYLHCRENAEGNLEVYEEIEIEIPKEVVCLFLYYMNCIM